MPENELLSNYQLNAVTLPGLGRKQSTKSVRGWLMLMVATLLLSVFALHYNTMLHPMPLRLALAFTALIVLILFRNSKILPLLALLYIAPLALVRRYLMLYFGIIHSDPLLAVIPLFTLYCVMEMAFTHQLKFDNKVAKMRLWLIIIMLVEIFNPKQGGIAVGFAGALFYITPLFWSVVGRKLGTDSIMKTFCWAVVVMGIIGALYGIKQTIIGFTSWEMDWLSKSGTQAFYGVNGTIREFSFFTSTTEYCTFLSLAAMASMVLFLKGQRFAIILLPLFFTAMLYTGERGPVVEMILGIFVILAVQAKNPKVWIPRLVWIGILGLIGLVWVLHHAQSLAINSDQAQNINHQTEGLLNPTNSKKSTANAHGGEIVYGIVHGFKNPLGDGLGASTLAASKFGGTTSQSEADVSNIFLSCGPVGGILFLLLIYNVFKIALITWKDSRSLSSLATLGFGCALLMGWLNGDNYSIMLILWFTIGSTEREYVKLREVLPVKRRLARPA